MLPKTIENEVIEGKPGHTLTLHATEYIDCTFKSCDFSFGDLRKIQFQDCVFNSCNMSSVIIQQTGFKNVKFVDSKMLGLRFDTCNTFLLEMQFENCQLNMSLFFGLNLKEIRFINCDLENVDFAEADLTNACFTGSTLNGAIFDETNLSKCDFREAAGFQINPSLNTLSKARFSRSTIDGLLEGLGVIVED
jgi:fluoroquinolone resistance protein